MTTVGSRPSSDITTIERFFLEHQHRFPDATGDLTAILYDLALAGKIVARHTTRARLAEILGGTGRENVHGEEVQKFDRFAERTLFERTIFELTHHTGRLAIMASEEVEEIIPIPEQFPTGRYVLVYDPLDSSSNIDVNVSVGTIFAIYHRRTKQGRGTVEDCLQRGRDLMAAGYVIYGSSTMMVFSAGHGVHGFTLDPTIGEFLLSHAEIRIPAAAQYYSVNQGYQRRWSKGVNKLTEWLQGDNVQKKGLSLRYIGSLVADFHRNLLSGGIFYYPADRRSPHGKLRLLYEAAPLAFLAEQAGGYASDGRQAILDLQPESLHQRVPLFIGNRDLVEQAESFIRQYDTELARPT